MAHIHIFLSTVSAEFRSYRDALRHDLDRPNVTVKVQEDFIATGTETLDKLDDYIQRCDAVIHLVGDMTGAWAKATAVAAIRERYPDLAEHLPTLDKFLKPGATALSYTQWEAWLALYHGKVLIIATPQDGAPRDERYQLNEDQRTSQQEHLKRLRRVGRYPEIHFANADRLAVDVLRSKLHDILAVAGVVTKPINLPNLSIGDSFKGREATVNDLSQFFGPIPDSIATPLVARVINGLGGVGKTRLALEYAWKHASEYTATLFVTADTPEALHRNLAALCGPTILNLPEQGETNQDTQRNAVVEWLRQHAGWLLILDNLDSEEAAAAAEVLLPRLTSGHALLTARFGNWSGSIATLSLDMLSLEAAAEFLLARTAGKRRAQPDDPATARTVAEELGRLALALEQAGAYIEANRLSFARYLVEWQNQRDKVLDWCEPRLMQYPSSVAITWLTSFERLSKSAQWLLQRLAWMAPEPIPESLLEVAVPDLVETDPFGALGELESYSLVTRAIHTPTFSVHLLVQEVTRRSQRNDPDHTARIEALRWLDAAFIGEPQDVRDWSILIPLVPHVRAVAVNADAAVLGRRPTRLLNDLATLYHAQGQYALAEPLYQSALAIREKILGPEHPHVATSLHNLAELYRTQGHYTQAEPLYQRALAILEKTLGPEHPDLATSLSNLASLHYSRAQYAQGELLHQRALAIREKVLGPDHPDVALSLNNLAVLYRTQRHYAQAEPLHQRALAIREKTLGPEHPDVAESLDNLAELYRTQSQYEQAKPLHQRALAIREKTLGPIHPVLAESLNNLAVLYYSQAQYAQAEPLYQRALAIREKVLGPNHPDVALSLNNLAALYHSQHQYALAGPLYKRALAILEKMLGSDHPQVATCLTNMAELYRRSGREEKAAALDERAASIRARKR